MPRYYFHLHNDMDVPDEEGQELNDLEAARAVAVTNIRELICEELQKGRIALHHRIDIADDHDIIVSTITFADVVKVEP